MSEPTEQSAAPALSSRATIYRKIAAVAAAVTHVEKSGWNSDKKYSYATPGDIFSALKPHMGAQSLSILPRLLSSEVLDTGATSAKGNQYTIVRVQMQYTIVCGESDAEIVLDWQGQAGNWGDDKGLASAQTICTRTFLIHLFQLPCVEPEIDPDNDQRPAAEQRKPQPQREQQRAQAVEQGDPNKVSSKQYGLIKGLITRGGYSDESTIEWCAQLGMGKLDTLHDLTKAQATQLIDLLKIAIDKQARAVQVAN